ncbi:hypothetical protein GHT06_012244 [Daphnia sinensis]|uniref:SOCS box domain-containing protein n=1 Tax=Daphnia sinensis TaxID=1820382 RepID=A0AAD5LNW2_9CRUS|nr:hypothetical protein GHT06_012244 [Daphnia sinensis]
MMLDTNNGPRPLLKKTPQDLAHVVKVGELRPAPRPAHSPLTSARSRRHVAECWHVIFAPDETRFAWLCGTSRVLIVPWNRFKNCLLSLDNTDDEGNEIKGQVVSIDAGSPVNSAGFGSGTPESQLAHPPQRQYWTRFDFSNKELVFATGHVNGRVRIWDVYTGCKLLELMDHTQAVRDLAFAPDGSLRLVSASLDRTIKVWDLRDDGNMFKTLKGHSNEIFWCCWSPNAQLLASAGIGKSILVWDMVTYSLARTLTGHHHNVSACEFSPDGAILASSSWDTRVILWDPYTGVELRELCHQYPPPRPIFASGANGSWVRGVAYARNGGQTATISDDGLIRFWNLLEPEVDPSAIAQGDEEMVCCTFSPSGRVFAVGTKESRVSFYLAPRVVFSLKHLARMAVRRQVLATPNIDQLLLPAPLKTYLKYQDWV